LGTVHFLCAGIDAVFVAVGLFSTLEGGGAMWFRMSPQVRVDWVAQLFVATPPLIAIHVLLGRGLRRFESRAFWAQIVLSSAVLVGFFATLSWELFGEFFPDLSPVSKFAFGIAHFAALYYLLASKCRRVITTEYRAAVEATPDLRRGYGWAFSVGMVPFAIAF